MELLFKRTVHRIPYSLLQYHLDPFLHRALALEIPPQIQWAVVEMNLPHVIETCLEHMSWKEKSHKFGGGEICVQAPNLGWLWLLTSMSIAIHVQLLHKVWITRETQMWNDELCELWLRSEIQCDSVECSRSHLLGGRRTVWPSVWCYPMGGKTQILLRPCPKNILIQRKDEMGIS